MTIDEIARLVVEACRHEKVAYMVIGAFAFNFYGVPRATNDLDVMISHEGFQPIRRVVARLDPLSHKNALVSTHLCMSFVEKIKIPLACPAEVSVSGYTEDSQGKSPHSMIRRRRIIECGEIFKRRCF
jgi:hypothetical protein